MPDWVHAMNTLDSLRQDEHDTRQRMIFEKMIEAFIKNWKPSDQLDAYQFEAQLFSIIRQLYFDAQQPALDRLT